MSSPTPIHLDTGGPAFPIPELRAPDGTGLMQGWDGMSMRDYFAIHADQPGVAEIVAEAGLVYSEHKVWSDAKTSVGTFDAWWRTIGQTERFRLYAVVRYRMADALIAVRKDGLSEVGGRHG